MNTALWHAQHDKTILLQARHDKTVPSFLAHAQFHTLHVEFYPHDVTSFALCALSFVFYMSLQKMTTRKKKKKKNTARKEKAIEEKKKKKKRRPEKSSQDFKGAQNWLNPFTHKTTDLIYNCSWGVKHTHRTVKK